MIAHHDQPEAFKYLNSDFSSEFGQLGIYIYYFPHLRSPYKLAIVLYISYERNRIINAHLHAAIAMAGDSGVKTLLSCTQTNAHARLSSRKSNM